MLAEPQAVPLMARFLQPGGGATGMGAATHGRIAVMAGAIGAAQAMAGLRNGADPALLAEGLMAFAFHSAACALCASGAGEGAPEDRAMAGLARLARRWLDP